MSDTRTPDARTVEELVAVIREAAVFHANDAWHDAQTALDTLTSRLEALEAERESRETALVIAEGIFESVTRLNTLAKRFVADRNEDEYDEAFDYATFLSDIDYIKQVLKPPTTTPRG